MAKATTTDAATLTALRTLRDLTPKVHQTLGADGAPPEDRAWLQTLDSRILPRLSPDFPLIAAITGGGSSGKSTLFNSLLGGAVSAAGGRAGMSRRVLVATHPEPAQHPSFLTELFLPFGAPPEPMRDREVLTTSGPPVYTTHTSLPKRVILLDTPDFDVGRAGEYLNRDVAAPVLSAADVLVYIFTNATYNAKANTEFISEQLTRVGRRQCVLVYRVYASFSADEVEAHAQTVAENLYGADWRDYVLGVYRADDDNAVAAGQQPVVPRQVRGGPGLFELLESLDPRELRREQNVAMIADVTRAARDSVEQARSDRDALALYHDGLRLVESHAIARALSHLPLTTIMERIREIFEEGDSGFLRFSRNVGRVTGAPLRGLLKLIKSDDDEEVDGSVNPEELARTALIEAANELRRQTLAEELTTATTPGDADGAELLARVESLREAWGFTGPERPFAETSSAGGATNLFLSAHPALSSTRQALLRKQWASQLDLVAKGAEELLELPDDLDVELAAIVSEFREDLPMMKRARAAMIASLNLVPSVVGIVYVFATVDPVGGSTLSAKLSSVFGLNDLWATVSIPASTGLDEATRGHLKRLLDPVVQRWLASRAEPTQAMFRERVTGAVIDAAAKRLSETGNQLAQLDAALAGLQGGSA